MLAFLLHWIAHDAAVRHRCDRGDGARRRLDRPLPRAPVAAARDSAATGELATFTVLLAVWAGDIGAFFAGRLIGRHKLAPALSPGKTWEGFLFGTVATIFVAFVALYKQDYLSISQSILLGAGDRGCRRRSATCSSRR